VIIAQFSDIHAGGAEDALTRLDRVVNWLRALRPDIVIVSGDLAEDGVAASYLAVRERLESLDAPFFAVPGNADDHSVLRSTFGELYGWVDDQRLNVVGEYGGVRVIGLDVTVRGAHHGDAAPVLEWLGEQLNTGGAPALIFLHQNPFMTGIDGGDLAHCINQEPLSLVIGKATDVVLGITCGHVHRALSTRFAGLPATMAPSVARARPLHLDGRASPLNEPPGLLLHQVRDGIMVSHVVALGQ